MFNKDKKTQPENETVENKDLDNLVEEVKAGEDVSTEEQKEPTCEEKLKDMEDSYLRLQAEFANYKRRTAEDQLKMADKTTAAVITSALPFFDALELSMKHFPEDLKDNNWAQGVLGLDKQVKDFQKKYKMTKGSSLGETLDPAKHEALMQGEGEKDTVIEVFEESYFVGDTCIRPAKVKVAA
ncbi:MAG: nucleotide exchange factor GrpE [Patescibacteria group bacterium]|nr:nucleotide exchange factor GrpE [Patescibacteria group bacterium]